MSAAFLGLGSNIGERISYIEKALEEIQKIPGTQILALSSIYETEPWGEITQEDFLNSVVEIDTALSAENLLKELKNIEKNLGRTENKKWSEREIDIDLLFYGNEIIEKDFMQVPHSQIEKRKFVLVPMNEIAPGFVHPVLNKTISALLSETTDDLNVRKYQIRKV